MNVTGQDMETKEVVLRVGKSFALPDPRLCDDPLYCEEVLLTGVTVLRKKKDVELQHLMDKRYEEVVSNYEGKLQGLKEQCERMDALSAERAKIIEAREKEIEQIQLHIRDYIETGRQAGRQDMDSLIEVYRQQLDEKKKELQMKSEETEQLGRKIDHLMEEFAHVRNIFKKGGRKSMSASAIGDLGEAFTEYWIQEIVNPAVLNVTSSDSEMADLHFKYEGVEILIEAKNKAVLRPDMDLEKFHRDVEKHASTPNDLLKAAILVNLQDSTLIYGWKVCYFETRHNMPVLYVGGIQERPILFTAAIYLLSRLAKSGNYGNTESSSEDDYICEREAHKTTAIQHLLFIHHMQEELNKDMKAHDEQAFRLSSRQGMIKKFAEYRNTLFDAIPGVEESFKLALRPTVGGDKRLSERTRETMGEATVENMIKWLQDQRSQRGVVPSADEFMKHYKINPVKLKRGTDHTYTDLKKKAFPKDSQEARTSRSVDKGEKGDLSLSSILEKVDKPSDNNMDEMSAFLSAFRGRSNSETDTECEDEIDAFLKSPICHRRKGSLLI